MATQPGRLPVSLRAASFNIGLMRVALTGATGFVGPYIVGQLLRREHELRALVREPARHGWLRDRSVEMIEGDLEEAPALRTLVEGADAVIHLVGIINEIGRQTYERVHVQGTM